MLTFRPTAYRQRTHQVSAVEGSTLSFGCDWRALAAELGESLSTTTWYASSGATLTNADLQGALASVDATLSGCAYVECHATFADGQIRKQRIQVDVSPTIQ